MDVHKDDNKTNKKEFNMSIQIKEISAISPQEFDRTISKLLKEGWKPTGYVTVSRHYDTQGNGHDIFHQHMEKETAAWKPVKGESYWTFSLFSCRCLSTSDNLICNVKPCLKFRARALARKAYKEVIEVLKKAQKE